MNTTHPIIVAVHADGFIEVYGSRDVHAVIVNVPAVDSVRGEVLAEEYVELNLPPRHRGIYAPGMVRAQKLARRVTPQEIADTRQELEVLRALTPGLLNTFMEEMQWQVWSR